MVLIAFQVAIMGTECFATTISIAHKQIVKNSTDESVPPILSDYESISFEDDEVNFNSAVVLFYTSISLFVFAATELKVIKLTGTDPRPFGKKTPVYLQISKLSI